MIERLPWLPRKSCYINLKFFETLKDTPNISQVFRFVAFVVLEILGDTPPPLMLSVGTKTLGAKRVKTLLYLARGLLDLSYCKIDSINQILLNISKIETRANDPKKFRLIFASHSSTGSPSGFRKDGTKLNAAESVCDKYQNFTFNNHQIFTVNPAAAVMVHGKNEDNGVTCRRCDGNVLFESTGR